ncbi:MAG: RdgB/HAM1 family non-canonical purine NTP pyrophosphatase [Planctomycetaceae bacterium]|nr:RdgB/HAM1 family non-canonical purine NTP pyrophosphatase [Planctomycetaceae bacterium]
MSATAQQRIVAATRNGGKLREIKLALAAAPVEILSLEAWPDLSEPVEDAPTFAENAALKARYYAAATGQWCLADDSGLVVDALDGRPGVHSARYAAGDCPAGSAREAIDRANNARLLAELETVDDARRTARFVCSLALADGDRIVLTAQGSVEGIIIRQRRGENGFGYDPIFLVPELGRTVAELDGQTKNQISHRGKALKQLAQMLEQMT